MFQESIIDVKSLRAAAENQHFKSLQSDLEALMKEHDSLFSVLQTVEKERDAFCEVSKLAQAGLKSLEEEIRKKTNELDAAATELLAANKHIVDASNEIAELQSLLTQREGQQQALEQSIRELESEVMGAISKSRKDKLEERIAELEQELELVSRERSNLICKGEAMHATIQVWSIPKVHGLLVFQFLFCSVKSLLRCLALSNAVRIKHFVEPACDL